MTTHPPPWPPSVARPADRIALTVLIVDDNRDAADSLTELLGLHGCAVRTAYRPEDALGCDPPDVALVELRLPGVSGWEVARRMRAAAGPKRPLLVAVTTCGAADDRRRSEDAGIDLHLLKPVEPAVLVGVLKRFARVLR